MGERQNGPFQLSFNASLKVDFQGSRVTSDGGLILVRELDEGLGFGELIARAEAVDSPQRVVLDMDSTETPVYGQQEQSAYNGRFESTCYYPLLLLSREGDCLAAKLRPGNVHSADDWEELLLPEIERQQKLGKDEGHGSNGGGRMHNGPWPGSHNGNPGSMGHVSIIPLNQAPHTARHTLFYLRRPRR